MAKLACILLTMIVLSSSSSAQPAAQPAVPEFTVQLFPREAPRKLAGRIGVPAELLDAGCTAIVDLGNGNIEWVAILHDPNPMGMGPMMGQEYPKGLSFGVVMPRALGATGGLEQGQIAVGRDGRVWIGADSEEAARQAATEALTKTLTWYTRHRWQYLQEVIQEARQQLEEAQKNSGDNQREIDELHARTAGLGTLADSVREQLQSQLLSLEVECAGARARQQAVREALDRISFEVARAHAVAKENGQDPAQASTVITMTARQDEIEQRLVDIAIDLGTLEAKRMRVFEFLHADKENKARNTELARQQVQLRQQVDFLATQVRHYEGTLQSPYEPNLPEEVRAAVIIIREDAPGMPMPSTPVGGFGGAPMSGGFGGAPVPPGGSGGGMPGMPMGGGPATAPAQP